MSGHDPQDPRVAARDFLKRHPQAHLLPVAPRSKRAILKGWETKATNNQTRLKKWADKTPGCNWGLNLGMSGLIVLDVDDHNGTGDGALSLDWMTTFEGVELPETLVVKTPSGNGLHYLFKVPTGAPPLRSVDAVADSDGKKQMGLQIKAGAGYVVLVGGVFDNPKTGEVGVYEIVEDRPIAEAPLWMVEQASGGGPKPNKKKGDLPKAADETTLDGWEMLRGFVAEVDFAAPGTRNNTLNQQARFAGFERRRIAESDAEAELVAAGIAAGLGEDEAKATFWSGYRSGLVESTPAAGEVFEPLELEEPAPVFQGGQPGFEPPIPVAEFEQTIQHLAAPESFVPFINRNYAVIMTGGRAKVAVLGMGEEGGRVEIQQMVGFNEFEKVAAKWGSYVYADPITGKEKQQKRVLGWMSSANRRTIHRTVFDPTGKMRGDTWNYWNGLAIEPLEERDDKAFKHYKAHVDSVICQGDPVLQEYVWAWMADLVQNPGGEKPGVALILKGREGTGKNVFLRPLQKIFGRHAVECSKGDDVFGRFNSILEQVVLVHLVEAFWAGDHSKGGPLKSLITDDKFNSERKGFEITRLNSFHRFVMSSNERWVVPAGDSARRFCVVNTNHKRAHNRAYFEPIYAEIKGRGTPALLRYLLDYDCTKVDLTHAPETLALQGEKLNSKNPIEQWWLSCLESGELDVVVEIERPEDEHLGAWPAGAKLGNQRMADACTAWIKKYNVPTRGFTINPLTVNRELLKLCPSIGAKRTAKTKFKIVPTLEQAREDFRENNKTWRFTDEMTGEPVTNENIRHKKDQ